MAKKKMIAFDLETSGFNGENMVYVMGPNGVSNELSEKVTKEGKLQLRKMLDAVEKSGILKDCYRVKHDKVDELFCQQVKNKK